MNKIWERPNLISIVILLVVLLIGGAYVLFTVRERPETESFTVAEGYFFPYNFDRLDRIVKVQDELREISGICPGMNQAELFAIQDEEGTMFIINHVTGGEVGRIKFDKNRDYEGIARKGNEIFVLEKDGDIHHFTYTEGEVETSAQKLETDFSYRNDTEGICYDSLTGHLLIVPKEKELNVDPEDDDRRHGIYSFDLSTGRLNPQPDYFIDEVAVGKAVFGSNRPYLFKPSGIAVDPVTHNLFVLSAAGNVLVVINRESQIQHVELLESKTFAQPEGITFGENGELFISSEGRGDNGIVATLNRNTQPVTNEQ